MGLLKQWNYAVELCNIVNYFHFSCTSDYLTNDPAHLASLGNLYNCFEAACLFFKWILTS